MFTSIDSQDSIAENTHTKKVFHVPAKFWHKTMLYVI
jgi:hypothetical protein